MSVFIGRLLSHGSIWEPGRGEPETSVLKIPKHFWPGSKTWAGSLASRSDTENTKRSGAPAIAPAFRETG